ncbi:MAG: tetratricopeptide repeat protein [Kiritimatiellae bacterium]|nr:tetratricopeptide repeat protein [Kiritimatiellia bacterium]
MRRFIVIQIALLAAAAALWCTPAAAFRLWPWGREPDYGRRVTPAPKKAGRTAADTLQAANQLKQAGKLRAADRKYRLILEKWPGAPEAAAAQYEHAKWLDARGEYLDAFRAYNVLFERYAGRFPREDVLERQLRIAQRMLGARRNRWFFGGVRAPELALPYFRWLLRNGPDWEKAPDVRYGIGRAHELRKDYHTAIAEYDEVLAQYPGTPAAEKATFGNARCLFMLSRAAPKDDALSDRAWNALHSALETYPRAPEARAAVEQRKILAAQRAARTRRLSVRAYDETHGRAARLLVRPAEKTPAAQLQHAEHLRLTRRADKSADQFRALVLRWPDAPEAGRAQYEYAKLLDIEGRGEEAFQAYGFLLDHYAGAAPRDEVLERQFAIAKRIMNRRVRRWFFGGQARPDVAIPYFEEVLRRGPDWRRAAEAHYLLGTCHASRRQYVPAVSAFTQAESLSPAEPLAESVALARSRSLYFLSRQYPGDVQAAERAWTALDGFLQAYPESAGARRIAQYREVLDRQRGRVAERRGKQAYAEEHQTRRWRIFSTPRWNTPGEQLAHANTLRDTGRLRRAARHYRALLLRWPGSVEAALAQYEHAKLLERRGKYLPAFEEYKLLMDRFAGRFPHEEVLDRMFQIAVRTMNTRKARAFLGGFEAPERAIPFFEEILKYGPRWEKAPEAQYLIGKIHEQVQQYEMAIEAYTTTEYRYPGTPFAEKSSFGRARCLYILAQESPNDDQAAETAWAALTLFIQDYPESEFATAATEYRNTLFRRRARTAYEKAVFYDKMARRPEAALVAYKQFVAQFPHSGWTTLAEIRIQELTRTLEQKHEE